MGKPVATSEKFKVTYVGQDGMVCETVIAAKCWRVILEDIEQFLHPVVVLKIEWFVPLNAVRQPSQEPKVVMT